MNSSRSKGFHSIPRAVGTIARLACARLREETNDAESVLSRAGLTAAEIDDPAAPIEVGAQIRLVELAAQKLDDDLFGFHLAQTFDLREIGLVYYVTASSETLADGLRNAERYSRIVNEAVRLSFSSNPHPVLALDYMGVDRRSDRHYMELLLVTLMRICRQVTNSRIAPRQLKVRHFRPGAVGEMKSFFGAEIEFGADSDAVVFSQAAASLPIVGRDTYLNKLLRRYADEALASRLGSERSVRGQVQGIVSELLPHGKATASEVARRLGMSARTLSRKLAREGASFAGILDELREALAKQYLGDPSLRVSEVAWLLGYQQVSSFSNAFKRRTGVSPRDFR